MGPVTNQEAVVAVGESKQQYAANRAGYDSRPSHEDGGAHAALKPTRCASTSYA